MENKPIPLKDKLYLSPIDKYRLYGRFPVKMVLHFLLIIATASQVILIINGTTEYTRAQERILYDNFVTNIERTSLNFDRKNYLFNIQELKDSVKTSIDVR